MSRTRWDLPFLLLLGVIGGFYLVLIVAMLLADLAFTTPGHFAKVLASREMRHSIVLSLISCTVTAILSVWVAVPLGYLMSRWDDADIRATLRRYRLPKVLNPKLLIDAILDIPIVLPPLVIGISLLALFSLPFDGRADLAVQERSTLDNFLRRTIHVAVPYAVPGVILAQFSVACAFAVRTMRVTFDQLTPRQEQVALTLGCSRSQAFWLVVLPEARRGIVTAATLAWARALGEFGPILIFAGTTPLKTEVLSSSVFLEFSVGRLESAVAVSLLMVVAAALVLLIVRLYGLETVR